MSKFLLIDGNHCYSRSKFSVRSTDPTEISGMCLHIMFNIIGKLWRTHTVDHVVFAFDNNSWRKSIYPPYKRNRAEKRALETPAQQELNAIFFSALSDFKKFIKEKTNCTVLENSMLEGDDIISGFIQTHSNDQHIIVSGDKDFEQLISENVCLYDGIKEVTTTVNGVFDYKGKPVIDKKTGIAKNSPDPEWSLFEKAIRGCTTDNVFAAYPGARVKGSKNKVGMTDAFEDRNKQGFPWTSFMNHTWMDHEGIEHNVQDDYNRNMTLVDLKGQPEDIKVTIFEEIESSCVQKNIPMIGLHFLKFCGKYDLVKISEQAEYFSKLLSTKYPYGNEGRVD